LPQARLLTVCFRRAENNVDPLGPPCQDDEWIAKLLQHGPVERQLIVDQNGAVRVAQPWAAGGASMMLARHGGGASVPNGCILSRNVPGPVSRFVKEFLSALSAQSRENRMDPQRPHVS
jgi:hypothetical protein